MPLEDKQSRVVRVGESKRERGKIAQREYRKRHASKFQGLKDENSRLRDAIRDISRIASRCDGLQKDLEDAISQARDAAGLEGEKSSTTQSSSTTGRSESPPETQLSPPLRASSNHLSTPLSPSPIYPLDNTRSLYGPGRFSPSLGQGLWLNTDRIVRIFDPPSDITPYLGDGMFSLAGCLYWACLDHAVALWRAVNERGGSNTVDQGRLDRLFNHSQHLQDRAYLVSLAHTRLEYKRNGYIARRPSQKTVPEQDTMGAIYALVRKDHEQRGETVQWWKSPQDVEDYVKRHIRSEDFAALKAVVEGRGLEAAVAKFGPLLETLAQNFICFGDGPRWNALHVSMAVGSWLENKSLQEIRVTAPDE